MDELASHAASVAYSSASVDERRRSLSRSRGLKVNAQAATLGAFARSDTQPLAQAPFPSTCVANSSGRVPDS